MRDAWDVYTKVGAVCLALCMAYLSLGWQLTPFISDHALRSASAFAIVQGAAIVVLAFYVTVRRAFTKLTESVYDQLRPAMRERVLALAFAGEEWSSVVPQRGPARHVLEECVANALLNLKESARYRVAKFASECGFTDRWVNACASPRQGERKRAIALLGSISHVTGVTVIPAALNDRHSSVRIEAARALLVIGDPLHIDQAFRYLLRESLLIRALLSCDLKRHARYLQENTIPDVLAEGIPIDTIRCLEIMVGWKRAIPSFNVEPWLAQPCDKPVWSLVLALLPYVPVRDSIERHLLSASNCADIDVQIAAARSIGQLKIASLIPELSQLLTQNKQLALASATAIAQMGEQGKRSLEKIVCGADRTAAAVALEALESAMVGP